MSQGFHFRFRRPDRGGVLRFSIALLAFLAIALPTFLAALDYISGGSFHSARSTYFLIIAISIGWIGGWGVLSFGVIVPHDSQFEKEADQLTMAFSGFLIVVSMLCFFLLRVAL